jgi:hypothetical protein
MKNLAILFVLAALTFSCTEPEPVTPAVQSEISVDACECEGGLYDRERDDRRSTN